MKMKRATLLAIIVTPVVAGAAGVMIGRANNASASDAAGYCAEPTMYIDMADGVSVLTGGPDATGSCEGNVCRVTGAEQIEVNADGRVQCVNVTEGQALSLTRRSDGLSVSFE